MTITRKSARVSKHPDAHGGLKVLRPSHRVRWSKVQAAQARIASGYYDREDVQEYVVEQILRELKRR